MFVINVLYCLNVWCYIVIDLYHVPIEKSLVEKKNQYILKNNQATVVKLFELY